MLPDGKLIWYNNDFYYLNKALSSGTLKYFTAFYANLTINGSDDTLVQTPIPYFSSKIIEFYELSSNETSSYTAVLTYNTYAHGSDTICVTDTINNSNSWFVYVLYNNSHIYSDITSKNIGTISDKIYAYNNSGYYDKKNLSIRYSVYYL